MDFKVNSKKPRRLIIKLYFCRSKNDRFYIWIGLNLLVSFSFLLWPTSSWFTIHLQKKNWRHKRDYKTRSLLIQNPTPDSLTKAVKDSAIRIPPLLTRTLWWAPTAEEEVIEEELFTLENNLIKITFQQ